MSEFKFSCAQCGQHLSADDSWVGRQIQCPSCQTTLVIPQMTVAAPPTAPKLSTVSAPPPVIPDRPQPARAQAAALAPSRRLSLLALASLLLSLSTLALNPLSSQYGWPVGLLGCVPGVIVGHMALTQLQLDLRLWGAPLAWIGLIFGYLSLVVALVAWGIYGYRQYVKHEGPLNARSPPWPAPGSALSPPSAKPSVPNSRPSSGSPTQPAPTPVAPRPVDPKVTTNPLTAQIPDTFISGTVRGRDFKPDSVTITSSGLVLKQGKEFFPDLSVTLFLRAGAGEILDGRKFAIGPQATPGVAYSIHVARKESKGGVPSTEIVNGNYALRLEFGTRQGNKIPGKIYLELPKSLETKIAGTFEVTIGR